MKKYIFFIALLTGVQPLLWSQISLNGTVYLSGQEANKKIPAAGASIYITDKSIGTISAEDGKFTLNAPQIPVKLVFSFVGFKNDTLLISNDEYIYYSFREEVRVDTGVVIEGRRKGTFVDATDPKHTQVITQKELRKAACCNLSESFETNPTVDVATSDAVTGMKTIELLGLASKYSQINIENIPFARGLLSQTGLSYIPGHWIDRISLSKGAGSVVQGYENISGQIDAGLKNPENAEKFSLNLYGNAGGRIELNSVFTQDISPSTSTLFLLHGSRRFIQNDRNNDSFLDMPLGNQLNLVNRWRFSFKEGWEGQAGIRVLRDLNQGGQLAFDHRTPNANQAAFGTSRQTSRAEVFAKSGYVFNGKHYKSIGTIFSAAFTSQEAYFGNKSYDASAQNFYANLIYEMDIPSTAHKLKSGISFVLDGLEEQLDTSSYQRQEVVPGVFAEYSIEIQEQLTILGGVRLDYHNAYGPMFSPRMHLKYTPDFRTTIRASAGRGWRTANPFIENSAIFLSSRNTTILSSAGGYYYGLLPEIAWNFGLNFTRNFPFLGRPSSFNIDAYHSNFTSQVVTDYDFSPGELLIYNLEGKSFSNGLYTGLELEPVERLEIRLAYRWLQVKTTYQNGIGILDRPLVAQHRGLLNIAYATPKELKFDLTLNQVGKKRIPRTGFNPPEYRLPEYSTPYLQVNAQVSKTLKRWELYVGGENLTNFRQENAIIANDAPFSQYFDASLVWGPIFGRMFYAGLRYTISR